MSASISHVHAQISKATFRAKHVRQHVCGYLIFVTVQFCGDRPFGVFNQRC